MNVKLTLVLEASVIDRAKNHAKLNGRSLSDLVENYFKMITSDTPPEENIELTPIVKSLRGSFKAPESFNYKEELSNALAEKYLSK
ncbi:DUF6364 family protein [Dyadobacter sp. 32]|uniref:DUF6364 family protein n=1 Tax=Dyadobacter sp. 32 TaxID=538966 RepID=UPI0011EDBFBF